MRRAVPLMRLKLRVLEQHGGLDIAGIAEDINRAEDSLWSWADGTKTCDPNTVPATSYPKLIDAIAKRIADISREDVERVFVSETTRELEAVFGVNPAPDLFTVLESRAEHGVAILHRKSLGLIETESAVAQAKPEYELALGEYFRLEIPHDMRGWQVFALQYGGRQWGVVPHSIDGENGHVHLPGVLKDGSYDFMREMVAGGVHRFFVVGIQNLGSEEYSAVTKASRLFTEYDCASIANILEKSHERYASVFSTHAILG